MVIHGFPVVAEYIVPTDTNTNYSRNSAPRSISKVQGLLLNLLAEDPRRRLRPAHKVYQQEKQRQVEFTKVKTVQLMLDNERKYVWDLKNELSKVPDVRKQAQLELAEQRCSKLQQEIENMKASQDVSCDTPRVLRADTASPPAATPASFLSGLPRSLSNLTGQSLRNLRHARHAATRTQQPQQQPLQSVPPLIRQKSDEGKRRHNNTVPLVPTTCLDNAPPPPPPPPLPPRRDQQHPLPPPLPASRRSHEPERDELQPNSIAMQMSYPLVNVSPPPLQTDNRSSIPVLHARSHSSPEQLDTAQPAHAALLCEEKDVTPPPGTPPPPYAHNTQQAATSRLSIQCSQCPQFSDFVFRQPCADPQRAIISMEEDDSTASETSTSLGLFSNLKEVKESRARMAVLLNWLLGERRCACSCLFLLITDGYRTAAGVANATLRRWAYEIQSTFLMPNAVPIIVIAIALDENNLEGHESLDYVLS
ncbi:hypothetical protein EVAR_79142_1 [Eumeta japonica]|uniref:Uncharacterized protein n=1 Tax=Eumeta variegata TaxID=151549 RepID=A0A4C1UT01_EUMVA|nr:hypothetical protein EVAR_79142_1 [Eumeta japonica]